MANFWVPAEKVLEHRVVSDSNEVLKEWFEYVKMTKALAKRMLIGQLWTIIKMILKCWIKLASIGSHYNKWINGVGED